MTDAPEYLRAGDVACLTGTSVRTVRRWIAEEILPSVKVRGARLVPRKDLERVLSPATPEDDAEEKAEEKQMISQLS